MDGWPILAMTMTMTERKMSKVMKWKWQRLMREFIMTVREMIMTMPMTIKLMIVDYCDIFLIVFLADWWSSSLDYSSWWTLMMIIMIDHPLITFLVDDDGDLSSLDYILLDRCRWRIMGWWSFSSLYAGDDDEILGRDNFLIILPMRWWWWMMIIGYYDDDDTDIDDDDDDDTVDDWCWS